MAKDDGVGTIGSAERDVLIRAVDALIAITKRRITSEKNPQIIVVLNDELSFIQKVKAGL